MKAIKSPTSKNPVDETLDRIEGKVKRIEKNVKDLNILREFDNERKGNRGGARAGSGWKRPANQIKVGRHVIKAGEQVLTRSTFADGTLTMGKIGILEIEQGICDGDFTILIRFEDGEKFVIGVYRE